MNENIQFKTDSLGRKMGLVKNFSRLDNAALLSLKETYMLSMTLDELVMCKNIAAKNGTTEMSISALYLLDELIADVKKDPKNIAISSFSTDSKEIFETYEDLIKRYSVISRKSKAMLPLADAFEVAAEYASLTGKTVPALPRLCGITKYDGTRLYPLSNENYKNASFLSDTVFALITPTREMSNTEYDSVVEDFISYETLAENIRFVKKISFGGIIRALSKAGHGVAISPCALPDMPSVIEPSHLVSEHHGRFLIALSNSQLDFANILCEPYCLAITPFAKSTLENKIFIKRENNSPLSLDLELLQTLSSFGKGVRACAVNEEKAEKRGALELENLPTTIAKKSVSVLAAELGKAPFPVSIDTALSAILAGIAQGIPRSEVSLKVKYSFSESFDEESVGANISAILGIYRVMSELYMSGEASAEYSNAHAPYISVSAIAEAPPKKIPTAFCHEHSGVYLLSFERSECGIPNFESFRGMCDFYQKILKASTVRSATAVCGDIQAALSSMSAEFECEIKDTAWHLCQGDMLGIIVECDAPIEFGAFLGTTHPKTEEF